MRLIAATRLSRAVDASTSIETQTAGVEQYVQAYDHQVVKWTEDLDVSGGIPIRDRPDIGPWLTSEHLHEWDGIIGFKLDRLFRSQGDYVDFYRDYCVAHGKVIISAGEHIDTSTEHGKFIADLLVSFAEMERGRMRVRRRDAAQRIRNAARWGGGSITFGYEPYKDGAYWFLRPCKYQAETQRMAEAILNGKSARQVAADLNARGVPTARDAQLILSGKKPTGKQWGSHTVITYLRSEALRGIVLYYRQPGKPERVLGPDGMPVKREPLLDDVTWLAVQRALDANGHRQSGNRDGHSSLLQVAFCVYCGSALHQSRYRRHGKADEYLHYYQCRNMRTTCKESKSIPKAELEDVVSRSFASEFGDKPMMERIEHPGDDHTVRLAEVGQQIADLTAERFVRLIIRPDYDSMLTALQAEHARLSALPPAPPRIEIRDTGKTLGKHWATLDMDGRGKLLRDMGLRVLAVKHPEHGVLVEWATAEGETDEGVFVWPGTTDGRPPKPKR